jgi:GTP-binding protein Era
MGTFRAGFVAIVGLPNVGKSTLLNLLLGQKIAITSPRPQTTRNRILGVKNLDGAQLVLVDTPGLHRPGGRGRSELNRYMVDQALAALGEVDAALVMVEAPSGQDAKGAKRIERGGYQIGAGEQQLLEAVARAKKPAVLALNKIDRLRRKDLLLPVLAAWQAAHPFRALVPISATTGEGVPLLTAELRAMLPEGERLFPEEMVTDRAERWLAAEMVREQVFLLTRQEVPYAVAVTIDTYEERGKDVAIGATIHVEKDAQKKIVVGEGGRMVREIGARARREIGAMLGCPVHLNLFVRVDAGWSDDARAIKDLGYE